MAKIGEESVIQLQVINWIVQVGKMPVIHIANERSCSPQYGSFLKKMGVLAGVSDLFFPRGNGKYPGMFIELKKPGGKLSPAQAIFLRDRVADGYICHIAYSANEAILMIKAFYSIE